MNNFRLTNCTFYKVERIERRKTGQYSITIHFIQIFPETEKPIRCTKSYSHAFRTTWKRDVIAIMEQGKEEIDEISYDFRKATPLEIIRMRKALKK